MRRVVIVLPARAIRCVHILLLSLRSFSCLPRPGSLGFVYFTSQNGRLFSSPLCVPVCLDLWIRHMLRIVAHFGSAAGLRHCVCTVCSGPICIFHGEWRMDCKTVGPHPVCTITDYRLERIETADRLRAERIAFRGRNRTGIVKICNSEMANIEKLARNVHYLYIREISVVAHRPSPAPTYILYTPPYPARLYTSSIFIMVGAVAWQNMAKACIYFWCVVDVVWNKYVIAVQCARLLPC